jgi:hypothetical protein
VGTLKVYGKQVMYRRRDDKTEVKSLVLPEIKKVTMLLASVLTTGSDRELGRRQQRDRALQCPSSITHRPTIGPKRNLPPSRCRGSSLVVMTEGGSHLAPASLRKHHHSQEPKKRRQHPPIHRQCGKPRLTFRQSKVAVSLNSYICFNLHSFQLPLLAPTTF